MSKKKRVTKPSIKEEDTAAVLMGKVKCYYCQGAGIITYHEVHGSPSEAYKGKCRYCEGKRWVKLESDPTEKYVAVIRDCLDGNQ